MTERFRQLGRIVALGRKDVKRTVGQLQFYVLNWIEMLWHWFNHLNPRLLPSCQEMFVFFYPSILRWSTSFFLTAGVTLSLVKNGQQHGLNGVISLDIFFTLKDLNKKKRVTESLSWLLPIWSDFVQRKLANKRASLKTKPNAVPPVRAHYVANYPHSWVSLSQSVL